MFDGRGLFAAATYRARKLTPVIGVDRERISRTTDRNIELFPVDKFCGELRIDMDDDAIECGALRRMRRGSVSVVGVAKAIARDGELCAAVESQCHLPSIEGCD